MRAGVLNLVQLLTVNLLQVVTMLLSFTCLIVDESSQPFDLLCQHVIELLLDSLDLTLQLV